MSGSAKEIIFDEDARAFLLAGVEQIAAVVAFTLGPKGRNVGLEKWGMPTITNDGNSIVKEVELANVYENMGAAMAREVAQKIKEKAGDGTTTGILLLHSIVKNAIKQISAGASPIGIKRGMDKAVAAIVKEIEKSAIPVETETEIRNIATVSASGNQEIGDLITEAMQKIGRKGVITIEEGKATDTIIEIVEGMQFDRGYISAYFCTNTDKMTVEMQDALILVVDKKINNIHELLPILQSVASTGKELLIIAEDIEGDALSTLVVNRLRGTLKIAAVKAPGFGDQRKERLKDIALATGATMVSEDAGIPLKDVQTSALGRAEKILITKDSTVIVNGAGSHQEIEARLKQIAHEIEASTSSYDKEKLEERKAKLGGGVAVIRVGAGPEMKQKKQMFEDSLNATRAAVEEGAVPGGGVALLRASQAVKGLKLAGDEAVGAQIILQACEEPLKQIVINVGKDGAVVLGEVLKAPNQNYGFNVRTDKVEDLVVAGVMDSAKSVKAALVHANSVGGVIAISEVLIADAPAE
jgi:chaperonin GroEL